MQDPLLAPVGRFANGGLLLSRIIICILFIWGGINKLQSWEWISQFLFEYGVPFASTMLVLAMMLEFGCGLLILVGFKTRAAAVVLLCVLIPATFLFHQFWKFEGMYAVLQHEQFMANLALVGGLLFLSVAGPGRFSVDARHTVWLEVEGEG